MGHNMTEKQDIEAKNDSEFKTSDAVAYGAGQIADQTAYQAFTILVFTFYYAVALVPVAYITVGFIIWSFWNSFNDPMLGWLSDRTHTKYGRRRPYLILALIPLGITIILLFTPPIAFGITDIPLNFVYFMIIICVFEFFYTMFGLNYTALFPETFVTVEERTSANNIRQSMLIIGLALGIILPGQIIGTLTASDALPRYQTTGVVLAILVVIIGFIFIKFTPREKKEFQEEYKNAPSFVGSIKIAVKNKSFMWYMPAEVANWFVYTMLVVIVPLYGTYVIGASDVTLLLAITFLSVILFITFLWKPIVRKHGPKKAWMMSMTIWIITLIPLMFISDPITGMAVFFFIGMGLSGSLYIIDLIVSDIIDEDELNTGMRREASYYGVNAFFLRLSAILVFVAIGPLFISADFAVFNPEDITDEFRMVLRILMSVLPIIALCIAIFAISRYPLDGERLEKVKEDIEILHIEKKSKV